VLCRSSQFCKAAAYARFYKTGLRTEVIITNLRER